MVLRPWQRFTIQCPRISPETLGLLYSSKDLIQVLRFRSVELEACRLFDGSYPSYVGANGEKDSFPLDIAFIGRIVDARGKNSQREMLVSFVPFIDSQPTLVQGVVCLYNHLSETI